MFSLIITIISIALVVALVAATMYHGGDVLTQGREKADAAAFVAGAQQISGASSMKLALEGIQATAVDATELKTALVPDYLSSLPNVEGTWTGLTAHTVTASVTSDAVCAVLEADGGDTYGCVAKAFTFNY